VVILVILIATVVWSKPEEDKLKAQVEALEATVQAQQDQIEQLQNDVAALEAGDALSPYVSVVSGSINALVGPHVIFEGVNVHIRSGYGSTEPPVPDQTNGLGNFIIGYNELSTGTGSIPDERTGSHNLVIGGAHTYSSWGGLVAGHNNRITGEVATVTGGLDNWADGDVSVISGGKENRTGPGTHYAYANTVCGGTGNESIGLASTVCGGIENTASGPQSTVSGGGNNTAEGGASSVSGGQFNVADVGWGSVVGDVGRTFVDTEPIPTPIP
jgi:hypothetical protein